MTQCGQFGGTILKQMLKTAELIVNGQAIRITAEEIRLTWKWDAVGAESLLNLGLFLSKRQSSQAHIEAGAAICPVVSRLF